MLFLNKAFKRDLGLLTKPTYLTQSHFVISFNEQNKLLSKNQFGLQNFTIILKVRLTVLHFACFQGLWYTIVGRAGTRAFGVKGETSALHPLLSAS
jgi:hypothetical protein